MAQTYVKQTDSAFIAIQIDDVVKSHVSKINTRISDGALTDDAVDDIRDRAQTIDQLLELRSIFSPPEYASHIIPLVRTRCGESVPS